MDLPADNPVSGTPNDVDLLKRIVQRDESAFEELLLRHQEAVARLAQRIVGRPEEARDVAQEVFLNLWENPTAFKPTAKFSTWLFRVTTNRAISHLRMRKIRTFLSFNEYDPSDTIPADFAEQPDQIAEKREEAHLLEQALMKLPPRQRAAIHLRFREEMSVIEVAQALDVSFKSAESLLFRAKVALKEHLKV